MPPHTTGVVRTLLPCPLHVHSALIAPSARTQPALHCLRLTLTWPAVSGNPRSCVLISACIVFGRIQSPMATFGLAWNPVCRRAPIPRAEKHLCASSVPPCHHSTGHLCMSTHTNTATALRRRISAFWLRAVVSIAMGRNWSPYPTGSRSLVPFVVHVTIPPSLQRCWSTRAAAYFASRPPRGPLPPPPPLYPLPPETNATT